MVIFALAHALAFIQERLLALFVTLVAMVRAFAIDAGGRAIGALLESVLKSANGTAEARGVTLRTFFPKNRIAVVTGEAVGDVLESAALSASLTGFVALVTVGYFLIRRLAEAFVALVDTGMVALVVGLQEFGVVEADGARGAIVSVHD